MSKRLSPWAVAICAAVLLSAGPRWSPAAEKPSAEQKIEAALGSPTKLQFVETPLRDVVDYLKFHHKIEIQVDYKALDDVGLDPSTTPITKNLNDVSLRSALRLMLRDLDLTYTVEDEVLLITTPDQAEIRLRVKFYPVADLIAPGDPAEEERRRDELVRAITASVEATSWCQVGGPGSITTTSFDGGPTLVVAQTYHVQRKIAAFLEEQRRVVRATVPRCLVVDIYATPASERIEKALMQPTEFSFVEESLQDAVDYLKKRHKIEIQIDNKALDNVGLDPSTTPITKNVKGISLRAALRLLLRDLDLTYVIQDEVLLITTPEQAEARLTTRIYAVGDLLGSSGFPGKAVQRGMGGMMGGMGGGIMGGMGGGMGMGGMGMYSVEAKPADDKDAGPPAEGDPRPSPVSAPQQTHVPSSGQTLVEVITTTIKPTSWDDVGGPGSIAGLSFRGVDVLVVSQTQGVHEEIGRLLGKLREFVRCNQMAAKPAAGKPPRGAPPKPAAPSAASKKTPAGGKDPFGK